MINISEEIASILDIQHGYTSELILLNYIDKTDLSCLINEHKIILRQFVISNINNQVAGPLLININGNTTHKNKLIKAGISYNSGRGGSRDGCRDGGRGSTPQNGLEIKVENSKKLLEKNEDGKTFVSIIGKKYKGSYIYVNVNKNEVKITGTESFSPEQISLMIKELNEASKNE